MEGKNVLWEGLLCSKIATYYKEPVSETVYWDLMDREMVHPTNEPTKSMEE